MSDEFIDSHEWEAETEDYEEISSEEVDRVVAALDELTATVESENIRTYLELASNSIFFLVYEEGDEDDSESDFLSEAA